MTNMLQPPPAEYAVISQEEEQVLPTLHHDPVASEEENIYPLTMKTITIRFKSVRRSMFLRKFPMTGGVVVVNTSPELAVVLNVWFSVPDRGVASLQYAPNTFERSVPLVALTITSPSGMRRRSVGR
jgi:hypothetical protein